MLATADTLWMYSTTWSQYLVLVRQESDRSQRVLAYSYTENLISDLWLTDIFAVCSAGVKKQQNCSLSNWVGCLRAQSDKTEDTKSNVTSLTSRSWPFSGVMHWHTARKSNTPLKHFIAVVQSSCANDRREKGVPMLPSQYTSNVIDWGSL